MSGKIFATEAEDKAYELGYEDGGNSAYADWDFVLGEEFDFDIGDGPMAFVAALREHFILTPKESK